ncbi:hypothetical protein NA56DRAFT_202364 [Hyaloscypha hepaticicola]|uniref:Thioredoxin domain-containing protein n=1 Tax=Hyaloscypha hepaticicola TaxID=2082293 RepID=A0A2J6PZH3_9HELO|nr:hypothetical protein NA56DRAFT_202364 [Hyaloscypha hepaticicola]
MPLRTSPHSPEDVAKSLNSSPTKPAYLVVYASVTDGRMWCGDCRDAESFVNAKFGDSGETATVVYAGSKPEWRSADNIWKKEPFLVTALPTIIKVTADGKWERLVEADVYDQKKLDVFVE